MMELMFTLCKKEILDQVQRRREYMYGFTEEEQCLRVDMVRNKVSQYGRKQ